MLLGGALLLIAMVPRLGWEVVTLWIAFAAMISGMFVSYAGDAINQLCIAAADRLESEEASNNDESSLIL